MNSIHVAQPIWMWLLPISLLVLAVVVHYRPQSLLRWHSLYSNLTRQRYRHPLAHQLAVATRSAAPGLNAGRWQLGLSYGIMLVLMHVCLAQPFYFGKKLPTPPSERDIVFIVDTSVSMLLRDYLVNGERTERMVMLKSVLEQFIRQLHGSRLAIVAYSEQPYTIVPLTHDYTLLRTQLQRLEPALLTGRSSDVSLALLYCASHFASAGTEPPVLVLITDATRPARQIDPRAAARYLSAQNFHLHVIGIGAASYAAREHVQQGLVYHPFNFQLLEEIAAAGTGKFFWAKDSADLQQALQVIQQAEQRPVAIDAQFVSIPLYQWPLAMILIWLSSWQILPLLGRNC